GLPDPGQRSTAEDLAKLIGRLLDDYPASRPLLGGATFVLRGWVYGRRTPLFQDPGGVQALKTGFTREAGYNLAVSAWKSGPPFLLILLGAQTRTLSLRSGNNPARIPAASAPAPPSPASATASPRPASRPPPRRRRAGRSVPRRPAAATSA